MTRELSLCGVAPKYFVREVVTSSRANRPTHWFCSSKGAATLLTAWWVDAEIALSAIEGNSEVAS